MFQLGHVFSDMDRLITTLIFIPATSCFNWATSSQTWIVGLLFSVDVADGFQLGHVFSDMDSGGNITNAVISSGKFQLGHVFSDMDRNPMSRRMIVGAAMFQLGHVFSDMDS